MYVAIRDAMLGSMNAEDGFAALEALGLDSVELTVASADSFCANAASRSAREAFWFT